MIISNSTLLHICRYLITNETVHIVDTRARIINKFSPKSFGKSASENALTENKNPPRTKKMLICSDVCLIDS